MSGHGFGHSTRISAFLDRLLRVAPCDLDVCAQTPPEPWPSTVLRHVRSWRARPCDVGVLQRDELHVDRALTERALREWTAVYPLRVEEEARRLAAGSVAVLGDVPPLAFDAAAETGVPSFALANFSWDWIYARLEFEEAAVEAERAYRRAGLLLELMPAAPMPAFRSRCPIGIFGRSTSAVRSRARALMGLAAGERLVLMAFRSTSSYLLPPPSAGVRYALCDGSSLDRIDRVTVPPGCSFLHMLAAADVVVAKTGYGIIADAAASGTPLLYTTRAGFPEDEVLAQWLAGRPWARFVSRERLAAGEWLVDVAELVASQRPEPLDSIGLEPGIEAVRTALSR